MLRRSNSITLALPLEFGESERASIRNRILKKTNVRMKIARTIHETDYIPLLKDGSVHVVAFAEEGFSFFKAYCEFALGFPIQQGVAFCNRINNADETGTLFPRGNLTAIPKRFFRDENWDEDGFRRCLRDAFIANRDHCKSKHLVFQFSCVQMHLDNLFNEIEKMALSEFADSDIELITVHFSGSDRQTRRNNMPSRSAQSISHLLTRDSGFGCTSFACTTCGGLWNRGQWVSKAVEEWISEIPRESARELSQMTAQEICNLPYWQIAFGTAIDFLAKGPMTDLFDLVIAKWCCNIGESWEFDRFLALHVVPNRSLKHSIRDECIRQLLSEAERNEDASLVRSMLGPQFLASELRTRILEIASAVACKTRDHELILLLLEQNDLRLDWRRSVGDLGLEIARTSRSRDFCQRLISLWSSDKDLLQTVTSTLASTSEATDGHLLLDLLRVPSIREEDRTRLLRRSYEYISRSADKTFMFEALAICSANSTGTDLIKDVVLDAARRRRDDPFMLSIIKCLGPNFIDKEQLMEETLSMAVETGNGFTALTIEEMASDEKFERKALDTAVRIALRVGPPSLIKKVLEREDTSDRLREQLIDALWDTASSGGQESRQYLFEIFKNDEPRIARLQILEDKFDPNCWPSIERRRKREIEQKVQKQNQKQLVRSEQRQKILSNLSRQPALERLIFIANDLEHSINFYPSGWADVDIDSLKPLDPNLLERLDRKLVWAKGGWKPLKQTVKQILNPQNLD